MPRIGEVLGVEDWLLFCIQSGQKRASVKELTEEGNNMWKSERGNIM